MLIKDKVIVAAGGTSTVASGGKSIVKDDSLVSGLLDTSVADILAGNFTLYGSDMLAIGSFVATVSMVFWRVYHDKRMAEIKLAEGK